MPETLDYAAPEKKARRGSVLMDTIGGFLIGVLALGITFSTLPLTLTPARLLFPLPMLLGSRWALVAALLQYPLYGAACGLGAKHGRLREALIAVAAVHVCCTVLL